MISPQLKNFEGLVSTEVRPNEGSGVEAFASSAFDASLSWKVKSCEWFYLFPWILDTKFPCEYIPYNLLHCKILGYRMVKIYYKVANSGQRVTHT
jgi:hypothetical protein